MRILSLGVLFLVACNTQQTRTVQGRLTGTSAQALAPQSGSARPPGENTAPNGAQMIVFSESTAGAQTVTQASPSGTFRLEVPINKTITLLVAVAGSNGYFVERHIGPLWFQVKPGGTIDLGTVRPEGAPAGELAPVTETPVTTCPGGTGGSPGRAELPYDAKLALGQRWKLADAFAEEGPQPSRVVSVTMDGSSWRLTELQNGTQFTVTQADCDHQGNRDVGRDRAFITWENPDGSQETDHLDLRYCDGTDSTSSHLDSDQSESETEQCEPVEHHGCGDDGSSCDDDSEMIPVEGGGTCPGETPNAPPTPPVN